MATIGNIDGSKFIGCPIIVPVTAGNITGATFHRVRIVVTVSSSDNVSGTFEFSAPASNGGVVKFDISSSLRAVAEKHEYSATSLSYPTYTASMVAYDDYLENGVEKHSEVSAAKTQGNLYVGRLTDRERLYGNAGNNDSSDETALNEDSAAGTEPAKYYGLTNYTRKPKTSPEICFIGNPYILAGGITSGPSASKQPAGDYKIKDGKQTIGGYEIYGVAQPADGFEMRIINSLGVHENVYITCLRQTKVNIKTEHYDITRQEALTSFSRGVTVKQNDYETWKMSSGPLDQAWQRWWLHEVLTAKWAWLNVDGQWLPIHIIPEETTAGIDRAKANLLEVLFTIRFDISGSPFK